MKKFSLKNISLKNISMKNILTFVVTVVFVFSLISTIYFGFFNKGKVTVTNSYGVLYSASTQLLSNKIQTKNVFHDQGHIFMQPLEPTKDDNVTIRIRVRRGNIKNARIEYSLDTNEKSPSQMHWATAPMYFERSDDTRYFDYFVGLIPKQSAPYLYHFVLENDIETVYYTATDCQVAEKDAEGKLANPFLSSKADFYVKPGFSTPGWSQGTTWYAVMTEAFNNGDTTNDKYTTGAVTQNPWGNAHYATADYFGGDFEGIKQKIDYMKDLGIESVYLNPINLNIHQAGYGAYDLGQIDSAYGNIQMLKNLVNELHANKMQIMLDAVLRYININGVYFNKSKFFPIPESDESNPYYDLFLRDKSGNLIIDWGEPTSDFSKKITRETFYEAENSIMQYFLREIKIDGWRMDVGSSLQGSDPANWGNADQILKDMRQYIKAANPNALFLSEHGTPYLFQDYALDSKWNYDFGWPVISWMRGEKSIKVIENDLFNGVLRLPRSIANSSYNFIANHDERRALYAANGDMSKVLPAQLLLMTYPGSPCIFAGDEVGMPGIPNDGIQWGYGPGFAPTSFSSVDWNEARWNYEIYNLTKALSALRKEYREVFRNGAFKSQGVDMEKGVFTYARWNDGGKVITTVNETGKLVQGVEINALDLEIRDGTVLTDYLTNNKYVVENGKVKIDVCPVGAVLVIDKESKYSGGYIVQKLGNTKGSVVNIDTQTFKLSMGNNVGGKSDNLTFAYIKAFNNSSVSAEIPSAGSYLISIRDSMTENSPMYGAVVDDKTIKVIARSEQGKEIETITEYKMNGEKNIKIARENDNKFKIYAENNGTYTLVNGSEAFVNMDFETFNGFSPVAAESTIKGVKVSEEVPQLATNFDVSSSPMLKYFGDTEKISVKNSKLSISPNKGGAFAVNRYNIGDCTFKGKLSGTPVKNGDMTGLVAMQSEKSFVFAGRIYQDGKVKLALLKSNNGSIQIINTIDNINGDIEIQLEKIGVNFSAFVKTGDNYQLIGENLNANFSDIWFGAYSVGDGSAEFDYLSYGKALEDGGSIATYARFGLVPLDFNSNSDTIKQFPVYKFVGGKFKFINGGYYQTDKSGQSQFVFDNTYKEFKIEATIDALSMGNNSSVGFMFGKSSLQDEGYKVSINKNGDVTLSKAGSNLATGKIDNFNPLSTRFIFEYMNGKLYMFIGESGKMVFSYSNLPKDITGKASFFGSNTDYKVTCYGPFQVGSKFLTGAGAFAVSNGALNVTVGTIQGLANYAYGGFTMQGVSDFAIGTNIKFLRTSKFNDGEMGLLIGGSLGRNPKDGGLYIGISEDIMNTRKLFIKEGKNVLASYDIGENINIASCYLTVVAQNKNIKIFLDPYRANYSQGKNSITPVIDYTHKYNFGGSINVYSSFVNGSFARLNIYGLKQNENASALELFKNRNAAEPPLPEPEIGAGNGFANGNILIPSFNTINDLGKLNKYSGVWQRIDGALYCNSNGNWDAGATFAVGKFDFYELKFDIRTNGAGWAGVTVNKSSYNDSYHSSGQLFYVSGLDGASLASPTGNRDIFVGKGTRNADGYVTVTIKAYIRDGKYVYEASTGASSAIIALAESNKPNSPQSGYISLNVGNAEASFKNISIKKLKSDGSPS